MNALFNDTSTKIGFNQFVNTFSTDYKGAVQNNIFDHLFEILALGLTILDSECQYLGVKAGAILRKLFSYKFID